MLFYLAFHKVKKQGIENRLLKKIESKNARMITLSFVFFGVTAFLIVRVIFESMAASFGFIGRYWDQALFQHGIPVGAGLVTFFILHFTPKYVNWCDEVLFELFKVVFPSRKDTIAMSIVCSILILLAGVMLGLFDFLATQILTMLINTG